MIDPANKLAAAATLLADAERAALQALLDEAKAFSARITEINESLPYPAGYRSEAKNIAGGMIANLSYLIGGQIPQLIQQMTPVEPLPVAQPAPEAS